ncbi:cytoplasmic dynein 2 intermediate chain 1 [Danaus plexippus]|uniref:cytoplasmic dynein 2 intermediate chain 1 n=1 Tax=Danaus plexippus TaxID=13037 RepID=UPI002AB2A423|nr:cytoplasmic dynein 2 intermediate chain 1 [Danaus plexippus]
MKTSKRRTDKEREHSKDDILNKKQEERSKKSVYSVSTPRNFVQKSSAADIYARKDAVKAPRKIASNRNSDVFPMKDLLKSSSSSVSQVSTRSYKSKTPVKDVKAIPLSARSAVKSINAPNRKLPFTNVTVNSPIVKRKLNLEDEGAKVLPKTESKVAGKRERTNTRTLDEAEIKVLTSDVVDNNTELLKLNQTLSAKPKAFFIDLEDKKIKDKSSDEEVSYEDDFESYESDFDSYHSESNRSSAGDANGSDDDDGCDNNVHHESSSREESKLDSGNFDLPERHKDRINPMEYIDEVPESDKKISLTDEGFQDMSSGLSSMKTLHVDILDRPLFIDFTESDANRKRRKIFERLRKRAEDITSMVKFHEISYNLFEMKPIPYELYMASFGRYNYTQTSVQTFDDGVSEEVQTEEVLMCTKWTQHPIEFSNQIIHLNGQDYLNNTTEKFHNKDVMNKANIRDTYINNPLRIYFEQKDGVGNDAVLPYDGYKNKLKKNQYDANKLRKFMKRVESRVCNVLSKNAGNINMSNLVRTSKFPFSTGYMAICTKSLNEESLVKDTEITGVVFSDSKSNLIITIHKKFTVGVLKNKCALCLWDLSVARVEPLKTLMASDDVKIGKFRGSTDGYFVGALEDGSISLWDLSEEAWWSHDANTLADDRVRESNLSQCELDREWNLRNNSNYVKLQQQRYIAQVSAFASSGINVCEDISVDSIVGLEFTDYTGSVGSDVIGQICSLQRIGVLTIWSIIRERGVKSDIGKALWSKIKLKRSQVIVLSEHLEANRTVGTDFNLNSAKKRIAARKREKNIIKRQHSRPKSSSTFELDRTDSVAINKTDTNFWENGIICSDLKIIHLKVDNYLVGKNLGEVLCCMKNMGGVKINRFTVANSSTMVTCLQTTKLPYFLAATDTGTINLCSLIDYRVLLTLDCRNISTPATDKCLSDNKGRFVESRTVRKTPLDGHPITSLYWSYTNPLRILCVQSRVCVWSLAQSDVNALCADRAICCAGNDRAFALLTPEGVVQIYELRDDEEHFKDLFNKYVTLL